MLTENGGKFAHTKGYSAKDNQRTSVSRFIIDPDGTASCSFRTSYNGLQYNDLQEFLGSNYEEQKKWLYTNSRLPSPQISSFSVTENRQSIPNAIINESLVSRNYGSFSGQYMVIPLNLLNYQPPIQKMLKPRISDILINRSSVDCDTMIYQIPSGYKFESLPSGKSINSVFGNYSFTLSANGNDLTYIRKFEINDGRYKPSDYKELYEFILAVSKGDKIKIMLVKK